MNISIDPEGSEIRSLFNSSGSFRQQNVLEIGCGDGRLTYRYAARAWRVTAIDPNLEKIERARSSLPPNLSERVEFIAAGLEEFAARFGSEPAFTGFDRAILAWSL